MDDFRIKKYSTEFKKYFQLPYWSIICISIFILRIQLSNLMYILHSHHLSHGLEHCHQPEMVSLFFFSTIDQALGLSNPG